MDFFMEHTSASKTPSAEFTPSIFDRLKSVMTNIGVFFNVSAYKKKIARYENELEN